MSKFRIDMISEEVRREADKIIREDMHDPRLGGTYCITRAEVTRDLRYAKMYVSILEDDKAEGVIAALKSGAGFIRRELAHRVNLRKTPVLQFVPDRSMEYAMEMSMKIEALAKAGGMSSEPEEPEKPEEFEKPEESEDPEE